MRAGVSLGAAWVLAPVAVWGDCCLIAVLIKVEFPIYMNEKFYTPPTRTLGLIGLNSDRLPPNETHKELKHRFRKVSRISVREHGAPTLRTRFS